MNKGDDGKRGKIRMKPSYGKKGKEEDIVSISEEAAEQIKKEQSQGSSAMEELSAELDKSKKEAAENYDKYIRAAAEFENYKKRMQRERSDLLKFGNETLLRDILPTLDSLERALGHADKTGDFTAFVEGLKLIHETLFAALRKNGVERIKAAGEPFDPHFHEALMQVEKDDIPANTVHEEFEKGYLLNGRLLRPSKVSIVKKTPGATDNERDEK